MDGYGGYVDTLFHGVGGVHSSNMSVTYNTSFVLSYKLMLI